MPTFSLPGVQFTDEEILRYGKWLLARIKRPFNPFRDAQPEVVSRALTNSVNYLLQDRITDEGSIGRYGWGHSDKMFMRAMYGEPSARETHDSVMTTMVVVEALHEHLSRIELFEPQKNAEASRELRELLTFDLRKYLEQRWNNKTGEGGRLVRGKENDISFAPVPRHTAWLMRLWVFLPGYRQNCLITAKNLVTTFSKVNRQPDKIATNVAAHLAFIAIQQIPELCREIGEDRVVLCKKVLEDRIAHQYVRELDGWTSGKVPEDGRQPYTLFVLAEMAQSWSDPSSCLKPLLESALRATMQAPWTTKDGGVPSRPGGPPDINASSLAFSAALRKGSLNSEEKHFMDGLTRYLLNSLGKADPDTFNGTWSWALSYFIKDACSLMAGH